MGIGSGTEFTMFSVSHFLLADKYQAMARNAPLVLAGQTPNQKKTVR
jgi:hypothetical protein